MDDLTAAHVMWLLGQDEQWCRPRASALPIAAGAAALCAVVDAGAAEWVDAPGGALVRPTGHRAVDPLVDAWTEAVRSAAGHDALPVLHAVDVAGTDVWELLGQDLVRRGLAEATPRPVRRWRPPRRRPGPGAAEPLRAELLRVVGRPDDASLRDHAVLAAAWCAGVLEHVLSGTPFTDASVIGPAEAALAGSDLVRRLEPAVSYLAGQGPFLGGPPTTQS